MKGLLDSIKKEVQQAKDAEIANKAFAESMQKAKVATTDWAEKINLVAGAMSNMGSGRIAAIGTAISSLVNNFKQLQSATTTGGKVGGFLNVLGASKQVLGNTFGAMASGMKAVGSVASLAAGGIGIAIGAFTGLAGVIEAPVKMIQGLADAITGFVSLVNPGIVKQFTLALNDTMAVLGEMFTPVLQGATIWMERIGDVFAKMMPVLQPLFDAFSQYLADVSVSFGELAQAIAPFVQLLVDALVPAIHLLAKGVAFVHGVIIEVYNTMASLFGLTSRFNKDAKSRGTAIRETSVSSVDSFAKELFAKSLQYQFGKGQGKKPEEIQSDILKSIESGKKTMEDIKYAVQTVARWANNPVVSIVRSLLGGSNEAAPQPWLGDAWRKTQDEYQKRNIR